VKITNGNINGTRLVEESEGIRVRMDTRRELNCFDVKMKNNDYRLLF
jgi:hypothetical protein